MKRLLQRILNLSMKAKIAINIIVIALLWMLSDKIQNDFSYDSLKDLIDILKNASAMIFTIVGIWIAYIYPNAITAIVKPNSIEVIAGEQDARRIEMLVGIIITSALIIIGIILFFTAKSVTGGSSWYSENRIWIKPSGIAFILFLSYLQILSILKVIFSNIMFLNDLHTKLNQKKLEDQL